MKNYKGLTSSEANSFGKGRNILTPPPSETWLDILMDKIKDPIIIILIVADIFSFTANITLNEPFYESIAIFLAIFITVLIGFVQDYSSKKEFDSLNKTSDYDPIKVIRDGQVTEVPKCDLCEGDVVILSSGDEVPADIELFEAVELHINEESLTGESVPVQKFDHEEGNPTFPSNQALRGTIITEGSGKGVVTSIGNDTYVGKVARQASEITDEKTPLTIQLGKLGNLITKLAFVLSGTLLAILNLHHFLFTDYNPETMAIVMKELDFIMLAISLAICSAPEGLPAAASISLALAAKKMMKDNNLVRRMKATETLGAVDIVFSDKTSTLTTGKMKVVDSDIVDETRVILNGSVNSTANLGEGEKVIGNPTEGAILQWVNGKLSIGTSEHLEYNVTNGLGQHSYVDVRNSNEIRSQKPFNSTDKYMMTTVADKNSKPKRGAYPDLVLVKGAPEVISKLINDDSYLPKVTEQQDRGRRAISFASGSDMSHLKYDGSVFIEDPLRHDVPEAIAQCYEAGIDVVMLTGDNVVTAEEIATQAGFSRRLQGEGMVYRNDSPNPDYDKQKVYDESYDSKVWAIEAKDFDDMAWGDPQSGYPNVIARCKPENKLNILSQFQEQGKVCAVTGDNNNDAPALNHSDVGLSMGGGSSLAKDSSDIILLDNSFVSIVKGIKWGRSLYKNIQSFLAFQLTVNVALCLTALFGPLIGIESPFSIIEILYINLVMDALGALALASEPAMDSVMKDKPRDKSEFIINKDMACMILSTGIPLFLSMVFVMLDELHWNILSIGSTGLFAMFMTINWMNLFRARAFGKNMSMFSNPMRNKLFVGVSIAILAMNILIVQFGGDVFNTNGLNMTQWIEVGILSIIVIVISELVYRISRSIIRK